MSSRQRPQFRKADATGRTAGADEFHIRIYGWMMKSEAWKALTPVEVRAYLEIESKFFGNNNGQIGLGLRGCAKACHMAKETAAKSLNRLIELGFIECTTKGGFNRKSPHATEWRLTRARCDVSGAPASKAFMRWKAPENAADRGARLGTPRAQSRDSRAEEAA
jgi:hypothetical protein